MVQEGNRNEPTPPGPPPGGERRAAPRHASTQRIACYPAGGGLTERRLARIRNVSKTGIGLIVDRCWQPGTALVLELPTEEGVRTVRAGVVHATSQLGGTFLVGCAFESPLGDAELQALAK